MLSLTLAFLAALAKTSAAALDEGLCRMCQIPMAKNLRSKVGEIYATCSQLCLPFLSRVALSLPGSSCSGSRPPSADSDCSTGRWFQFSFSKLVRKCPEETSECLHIDRSAKEMIATWCHSIPLRHSSAPCSKVHPSHDATTSQHHWPTWTAL